MNRWTLLGALLTVFTTSPAQTDFIKADIFRLFIKRGYVAYEHVFNKTFAVQLGMEYGVYGTGSINGTRDYTLTGFTIVPEMRWYPLGLQDNIFSGWFLGETLRYSSYSEKYANLFTGGAYPIQANSLVRDVGFNTGLKWGVGKFFLEVAGGVGLITKMDFDSQHEKIPLLYRQGLDSDENLFYRFRINLAYSIGVDKEKK